MFDNTNTNDEEWDYYPVKGNYNVVRLPILGTDINDDISITFDRSKASYSIAEQNTSETGLISGTTTLYLDGTSFNINLTYNETCEVIFR